MRMEVGRYAWRDDNEGKIPRAGANEARERKGKEKEKKSTTDRLWMILVIPHDEFAIPGAC
jgi:hypothetical protein